MPATLNLPRGIRAGLQDMTIDDAVKILKNSGKAGPELIEQARQLVSTRMQYCRRNSFDSFRTAFRRGYGYCQQQTHALQYILGQLGFEAKVVHACRNKFRNGNVGGHAWVRLVYNGMTKDIDATDTDLYADKPAFRPLSPVKYYTPLFRIFSGWGSIGVNAIRYYMAGRD